MDVVKFIVFCGLFSMISGIEPISAIGAIGTAVVAGIYTVFTPIKCHFHECCTSNWINLNTTGYYPSQFITKGDIVTVVFKSVCLCNTELEYTSQASDTSHNFDFGVKTIRSLPCRDLYSGLWGERNKNMNSL